MKKIILSALALLATVATFAQSPAGTFTLKPEVGLTIANITNSGGSVKLGFIGGLEGEYQLSNRFSLSGAVVYSMQGTKDHSEKINTSYVNVPILVNLYLTKGFAIKAGVQPGFLAGATASSGGMSGSMKAACNSIDFSIPVGVSYEFNNIVFDARYNIGVTNVLKGEFLQTFGAIDTANKNSVFQITLGYKFAL